MRRESRGQANKRARTFFIFVFPTAWQVNVAAADVVVVVIEGAGDDEEENEPEILLVSSNACITHKQTYT
jgi:hypothetical protein